MGELWVRLWKQKARGCTGVSLINSVKLEGQALELGVGDTRMNEGVSPALNIYKYFSVED